MELREGAGEGHEVQTILLAAGTTIKRNEKSDPRRSRRHCVPTLTN